MKTYDQYLRESAVPKEVIDVFLDPATPTWSQFDPDVGYILGNYMPRDGVGGSSTISTVRANGARTGVIYANRPCRINTYGNSYTQCHQVGDEETWQEYLAAHLGEPVRNFGMGGFGVYQAYRRMKRTEATEDAAEYVILYIWGDDHCRSCMRARHFAITGWFKTHNAKMFHGNFWANIEMDLEAGRLVEKESLCPTPESLYNMCDPDFVANAMKDDLMVQLYAMTATTSDASATEGFAVDKLNRLAEILGCDPLPATAPEDCREPLQQLKLAYGHAATKKILADAAAFAGTNGKKLMVIVFSPSETDRIIQTGTRSDQPIVDYLREHTFKYFDMNLVHVEDFKCFNMSLSDYWKRYRVGHYSPAGNHFFAHALRPVVVDWLEPKPITYRNEDEKMIDFEAGYLRD
ncbi:MAG: hypothetical protein JXR37_11575 [Kiritimatiellae bacterium]|nr:hypothetical protein [Kiritimatiellia bacterium]